MQIKKKRKIPWEGDSKRNVVTNQSPFVGGIQWELRGRHKCVHHGQFVNSTAIYVGPSSVYHSSSSS